MSEGNHSKSFLDQVSPRVKVLILQRVRQEVGILTEQQDGLCSGTAGETAERIPPWGLTEILGLPLPSPQVPGLPG